MSEIFRGESAFEDTPYTLLGRFCALVASGALSPIQTEGTLILKTDITSISVKTYDDAGELIAETTPSKNDVWYDALQTTGVWAKVKRGGNFLYTCPATMFPAGNELVRLEITVTLTTGEPVRAVWQVPVINLVQS